MPKHIDKLIEKIKAFGNKRIKMTTAVLGAVILAAAALAPSVSLPAKYFRPTVKFAVYKGTQQDTQVQPTGVVKPAPVSLISLQSLGAYNGLPVSNVTYHPVSNAQGTIILLPQYHRDPTTTNIMDPANDSGQRNQQQSVDILKYLVDKADVNLVMVEGDLKGDVPQSKIDHIKNEMAARDRFAASVDSLKQQLPQGQANSAAQQQLIGQLQQELNNADRDIYLQGAPYVVKAEGGNVTLVGAENQDILDSAAKVVRDYVYVNDRLMQVQQPQTAMAPQMQPYGMGAAPAGNPQQMMLQFLQQMMGRRSAASGARPQLAPQMQGTANPLASIGNGNMQQILQQMMGGRSGSPEQSLSMLQSQAQSQGNQQLASTLSQVQQAYQDLKSSSQTFSVATTAQTTSNAPSRANNPYSKITDPNTLQNMLKQAEQKVNEVVIGERNQAAATNIVQSLKDHNQNVAVLQFGAGHEEGLVQELNKQNLNVIVVTTNEVAARAGQQA